MSMAVAAGVLGAVGALQQARSTRQAYETNAGIAERNAVVAQQQASAEEARQRRQADMVLGRIRSGYGASGVTPEGSPLDILEMSVANAELDALNTRYKGQLQAIGYRDEAAQSRHQASAATRAGYWKAAASLAGGAAYSRGAGTGSDLFASGTRAPVEDRLIRTN